MKIRKSERVRNPQDLVNRVIVGDYPAANYRGVRLRYERRRVLVSSVRVIRETPLALESLSADPLLRRTRILVSGMDIDKNAERSFYLGAFKQWRACDTIDLRKAFKAISERASSSNANIFSCESERPAYKGGARDLGTENMVTWGARMGRRKMANGFLPERLPDTFVDVESCDGRRIVAVPDARNDFIAAFLARNPDGKAQPIQPVSSATFLANDRRRER